MIKNKPYRICTCGKKYYTELAMYKDSICIGLQKTQDVYKSDFELRKCKQCGTSFVILSHK